MPVPPVSELFVIENSLWEKGYDLIGGIDEAGRGPLAGPVVSACVIIKKGISIEGVYDSKSLSASRREYLFNKIIEKSLSVTTGIIDHKTIDSINIYNAAKLSMNEAVLKSAITPDFIITDAMKLDIEIPHLPVIKGDRISFPVAAASIIAKVTRDRIMDLLHLEYPLYNWLQNKGYPTESHGEASALRATPHTTGQVSSSFNDLPEYFQPLDQIPAFLNYKTLCSPAPAV